MTIDELLSEFHGGMAERSNASTNNTDASSPFRASESCASIRTSDLKTASSNLAAPAILSYSFILGVILALFALTACGQPLAVPNTAIRWTPNTETNLAEYRLYDGQVHIASLTGTHLPLAQLALPTGVHRLSLTAVNTAGLESFHTASLIWTNTAALAVSIQSSSNLQTWAAVADSEQVIQVTNQQRFYRAVLSIR